MTAQAYEQFILAGIKGLPEDILAEIADFVLFVRKRALQPAEFEDELRQLLIRNDLQQLSRDQEAHLEKEFENYEQLYPN